MRDLLTFLGEEIILPEYLDSGPICPYCRKNSIRVGRDMEPYPYGNMLSNMPSSGNPFPSISVLGRLAFFSIPVVSHDSLTGVSTSYHLVLIR